MIRLRSPSLSLPAASIALASAFWMQALHAEQPPSAATNSLTPAPSEVRTGASKQPELPRVRRSVALEGWTIRVDERLYQAPHEELRLRTLRFLENKLADIRAVVPMQYVEKLQSVPIVLDLNHGKLGPMQYHPSAEWLETNGYARDLAKSVHLPRAADVVTSRNIREQPWVILHELAHAYHDQVLGFDDERIRAVFNQYKASGRGEKLLLHSGKRVRHYGLSDHKEFFAEMTESYFGSNDFYPFNRAELQDGEPEIYALMKEIWVSPQQTAER